MKIEMGQSETSRQPQVRMSAVELRRKRQKRIAKSLEDKEGRVSERGRCDGCYP